MTKLFLKDLKHIFSVPINWIESFLKSPASDDTVGVILMTVKP